MRATKVRATKVSVSSESDESNTCTVNEEERSSNEARAHTESRDCDSPEIRGESQVCSEAGDEEDDRESRVCNEDEESDGGGDCSDDCTTRKSCKRVRRPKKWKKSKRIARRNSGKCYTSVAGKQVMLLYYLVLYMACTLTHLPSLPFFLPSSFPLYRSKPVNLMTHHAAVLCVAMISSLLM